MIKLWARRVWTLELSLVRLLLLAIRRSISPSTSFYLPERYDKWFAINAPAMLYYDRSLFTFWALMIRIPCNGYHIIAQIRIPFSRVIEEQETISIQSLHVQRGGCLIISSRGRLQHRLQSSGAIHVHISPLTHSNSSTLCIRFG